MSWVTSPQKQTIRRFEMIWDKQKLPYLGRVMGRADSLEETLQERLRAKEKDARRARWLDGATRSLHRSLSKLRETAEGRGAWWAAVHGVAKSWMRLSNWTAITRRKEEDEGRREDGWAERKKGREEGGKKWGKPPQHQSRQQCLTATAWTVAPPAPLAMGLSREEAGAGCHALLQEVFLTQGSNPCLRHLLHCRWILYHSATGEAHLYRWWVSNFSYESIVFLL